MFKLIKVLLVLAGLAGLAFAAFFVQFGDKTLYEHLVGISRTEEARALGGEIGKKAEEVTREVKRKIPDLASPDSTRKAADDDAGPLADIPREDRRALDDLLRAKKAADKR